MRLRTRAALLVSAATVLSTSLAAGPASGAVPTDQGVAKSPHKLACSTAVIGQDTRGRFVQRSVDNKAITEEKLSVKRLPFTVKGMVSFGSEKIPGGYKTVWLMTRPGGAPREVTTRDVRSRRGITFATDNPYREPFSPNLIAGSGGYYVFTWQHGVLKRWTDFIDRRGIAYFGHPEKIGRVAGLTAITISGRATIGGVESDYLVGTTSDGRLLQFKVPVEDVSRTKTTVLARHGFESTTDLSLSRCNGENSHLSIIAVHARYGEAAWYSLRSQFHPRARNLVDHGLIATEADWNLHAVV